ncbi:MAG: aminoglycoside phosphotransferase [Geodermatophilaceae bacterium]|nr:aminoglycoside phosphotransferase [Geodermatophilaceae bacterium]
MTVADEPSVPPHVLTTFGLMGHQRRLPGGMGTSVLIGDVVLKPAGDDAEAQWLAELQQTIAPAGIRVPRPIGTADGRRIVEGWTASPYLPGQHERGRWAETIEAGRRLHEALARLPRPDFLDARDHRWAHADRVAWGEADVDLGHGSSSRPDPLDLPRQLVHCDLAGNVLFHPSAPPAVLDLSLYWRPPAYADAIVVVDALLWYGAADDVLDLVDHPDARQLLNRALTFRLACELHPDHQGDRTPPETWRRVAALID